MPGLFDWILILQQVLKAFFSLASLTLFSRFSGFFKVAIFAAYYGRGNNADIFLAVMILPDLLYKFLSEGLITSAAIPIFVELRNNKLNRKLAYWSIFITLGLVSTAISFTLVIFSPQICAFIMPGFSAEQIPKMVLLWNIMTIYLVFGILSGFITAFLNAQSKFAIPAIGPLLVNLTVITGIFIAQGKSITTIALAVITGSFIQFVFLFFLGFKNCADFNFGENGFEFDTSSVLTFFKSILPVASWVFLLPFIPVYERYLLSMQQVGSIATLNYVEKLFNLPLGIVSISAARVIFPELSKLDLKEKQPFLIKSLVSVSIIILPIIIFVQLFSSNIVEIVFARGKFGLTDVKIAASLFKSYSLALLPLSLTMILNRNFFSLKQYKIPFFAGLTAIIIQFYLAGELVTKYGITGIGYSAFIAFSFQFTFLIVANSRTKILSH